MSRRWPQVLVEGARLGLDLGDKQLLDRYQRWRSLDALSVAFATDSLTRIYGIPGKTASAVRRFGMGLIDRISPIRNRLMSEARGTSGELAAAAQRPADLVYWIVGSISTPPVTAARWNCISWTSRSALPVSVGCFEQRLLGADIERRDLGDGIDQHLVVEPADRVPIDRKPIASPSRRASRSTSARSAIDSGGGSLVIECLDVDFRAAIGGVDFELARSAGSGSIPAARC